MTSEYMQVPDDIKLVKFETDKLQMGDIIAYYSPSMGEVLRYLIHEVDGCQLEPWFCSTAHMTVRQDNL